MEINSTSDFQKAIEQGLLAQAEEWLLAQEIGKKYDERWRDHQERALFKAYYAKQDWASAKRIVELSIKPKSKEDRIKRLQELSGKNYEEI